MNDNGKEDHSTGLQLRESKILVLLLSLLGDSEKIMWMFYACLGCLART